MKNEIIETIGYTTDTITLADLLKLKPIKDQIDESTGASLLNTKRFLKYAQDPKLYAMLNSPTNPIVIDFSGRRIIQGNHRTKGAEVRQSLPDKLDPSLPVKVVRLSRDLTAAEVSLIAYVANMGNATDNYRAHVFGSKMELSVKVMAPVYEALKKAGPNVAPAQLRQIAQRIGALFNRNPYLVELIKEGAAVLPVTLQQIMAAGRHPEATKNFHEAEVNVDLRGLVNDMAAHFVLPCEVARRINMEQTLSEKGFKTSGRSTVMYLVFAWGLSRFFTTKKKSSKTQLSIDTFIKVLNERSAKLKNAIDQMYDKSAKAEDTFKSIFMEETSVTFEEAQV